VVRLVVTLRRLAGIAAPVVRWPVADAVPDGADLVVRGVTFGWSATAEPVVADLDLVLPAGEHIAIVGASGIGKSTVAGLLTGLLQPDRGCVLLVDTPV